MTDFTSLIAEAQAGDLHAYGQVVQRFQDMAYGYAYSIIGDFHLAQDAAQEAFIEAHRCLPSLRDPAAFPGWFRRIVHKHCDRLTRGKRISTVPLGAADGIADSTPEPAQAAEAHEMTDNVLEAIGSLPANERTVTTLFYINGYSQADIAAFLEVPDGTVKSRLHASRKRLKERMMDMVEQTLHQTAPDERFRRNVIDQLLARPRLLEIEGHPLREVFNRIKAALPDYEVIQGEEVVTTSDSAGVASGVDSMYHVDKNTALRTETTITTFRAMVGRTPPVRLITAGRVFRDDPEDSRHQQVFHQLDALCIEAGADQQAMKNALRQAIETVLQPVQFQWEQTDYPQVEHSLDVSVKYGEHWLEIAGGGVLTAETLEQAGYDPDAVSGFAFGLGLERIAMAVHGLDDIRQLWQPPYVQ